MEVRMMPVSPPRVTEGDKIYLLYVFNIKDTKIEHERCWGYFFSFEEPEHCIINNVTDIFERGYYTHAKVVVQEPGLAMYSKCRETKHKYWYKAEYHKEDIDEEGYLKLAAQPEVTPCDTPIKKEYCIGLG